MQMTVKSFQISEVKYFVFSDCYHGNDFLMFNNIYTGYTWNKEHV